jgi:predicted nuclease of predicted toxin-antitoxin system
VKIVVDEHIPLMTVRALRAMEHEVYDIRGTPDEGMQDDELWTMVQRQRCLLITTDKGFTQYRVVRHHGVLIIRLRQPNRHKIHYRIMQAMAQFAEIDWPGLLVVMRDKAQSSWQT